MTMIMIAMMMIIIKSSIKLTADWNVRFVVFVCQGHQNIAHRISEDCHLQEKITNTGQDRCHLLATRSDKFSFYKVGNFLSAQNHNRELNTNKQLRI